MYRLCIPPRTQYFIRLRTAYRTGEYCEPSNYGFDYDNESYIIATTRQRRLDVALNVESKYENPVAVGFDDKKRFIGMASFASTMLNQQKSTSQKKQLLGGQFVDSILQRNLTSLSFVLTEGPDEIFKTNLPENDQLKC